RRHTRFSRDWSSDVCSSDLFPGFLDLVLRLRRDLGIPHTLDRIGVDDARINEMAAMAVVDPTAGGNPRALTVEDARDLYERALRSEERRVGKECRSGRSRNS